MRVARQLAKFCPHRRGLADLYPRFGRTWNGYAAGHAVLAAAGGHVETLTATMRYGKHGFENPNFIARRQLAPMSATLPLCDATGHRSLLMP